MTVLQSTVDAIMVKCARRCCICRRFAPLHLQIHHIVETAKGGSDEEGNLIPVCLTCHSDAHIQTALSRRFTPAELRGHRDSLFAAVAAGNLSSEGLHPADLDRIVEHVLARLHACTHRNSSDSLVEVKDLLSAPALSILLTVVRAADGVLAVMPTPHGLLIEAGGTHLLDRTDPRKEADYRAGLDELMTLGLLDYRDASGSESLRVVTQRGYLLADQIVAGFAQEADRD